MNRDRQQRRLYLTWHRCADDGRDHAVTDAAFKAGLNGNGRYESVCGHVVLIDSVMSPSSPQCARCWRFVNALLSLPTVEQRLAGPRRHRRPGRLSQLFRHSKTPVEPRPESPAVPLPRSAVGVVSSVRRNGRMTPAGAGGRTTPVPAGRHSLREAGA